MAILLNLVRKASNVYIFLVHWPGFEDVKPQSHRIVRFLDRTIGCDWAKVRPIGHVCYDLQQRSHTRSISTRGRAITNDCRISMARAIVGIRATSGTNQRPMYDLLLCPTTDRTINRDGRRQIVRSIVASCERSYEQSWHPACDRSYEHS